jgi:hypothetical protein
MFEQLEFDFDTPTLETRNDRWVKSEIRNCNVCGKDYILYTQGPQTETQEAGPNFCCNECWKLGFILINRGGPYFHKLCEVNEISMADVTRAETEATRREFPYLHRRDNLVK